MHRTLRSSHPVKRTLSDGLLIATGAGGAGVRDLGASGAPFSCDLTFEARAQSGNLDPESKTWIIETARRFYQDRSRDFPDMPPIGELRVALRGFEETRGLNPHTRCACVVRFVPSFNQSIGRSASFQEYPHRGLSSGQDRHDTGKLRRTQPTLSYAEYASRQQCDEMAADHTPIRSFCW